MAMINTRGCDTQVHRPYAVPVPAALSGVARQWLEDNECLGATIANGVARFCSPSQADLFAEMLGELLDSRAA